MRPFRLILFFMAVISVFYSCRNHTLSDYPDEPGIFGLATTIKLSADTTYVVYTDFFPADPEVDSASINGEKVIVRKQVKTLVIPPRPENWPQISVLKIWTEGYVYSIPAKKSSRISYTFTFDPKGKAFQTAGLKANWNGWDAGKNPLTLEEGSWKTTLRLDPGDYQYLLVLDGKQTLDPYNPDSADNNNGGFNSVLKIRKPGEKPPSLVPVSAGNYSVYVKTDASFDKVIVLWQNYELGEQFYSVKENALKVSVPINAKHTDRTFLRIWVLNNEQASNELLIPLEKGKVVISTSQLTRTDWEGAIIYSLMVDRFFNGNKDNDKKVNSPEVDPRVDYFGGDIEGVQAKLNDGYFDTIGVNTLWLTPIYQNPEVPYGYYEVAKTKFSGYHGYWPITSTTIDHRFGNEESYSILISNLHASNMNILFDMVANHVHEEHHIIKTHPDWATPLKLPDGRLNVQLWDEQRLTTWFDVFMPSLDLESPAPAEFQSDSAMFWVEEYGIDGFRHDATKHIPESYWRLQTMKLKNRIMIPDNKRMYQVGETFGSRELIGSYVNSGQMDGQFDFDVYFDARGVFIQEEQSFEKLNTSILSSIEAYGDHHLMGNITGNHDLARFISLAGRSLSFSEDPKLAAWTKKIEVGDPVGYNRLQMMNALIMTIPGIPVIYYGDEIGLPGAGDPDNRRLMKFDSLSPDELKTRQIVSKLSRLRMENLALIYGTFEPLKVDKVTYVFLRRYLGYTAVVVFNKSRVKQKITFSLPAEGIKDKPVFHFQTGTVTTDGSVEITLGPASFAVLESMPFKAGR